MEKPTILDSVSYAVTTVAIAAGITIAMMFWMLGAFYLITDIKINDPQSLWFMFACGFVGCLVGLVNR